MNMLERKLQGIEIQKLDSVDDLSLLQHGDIVNLTLVHQPEWKYGSENHTTMYDSYSPTSKKHYFLVPRGNYVKYISKFSLNKSNIKQVANGSLVLDGERIGIKSITQENDRYKIENQKLIDVGLIFE